MKSKLFSKIIVILVSVLFMMSMFSNFVYADNFSFAQFDGTASSTIKTPVQNAVGAVISVMRIVATAVAIIMLMVLAIKYIVSSPGERAEIKKSFTQYVVGAVVLFSAAGILKLIQGAVTGIVGE